jgi:hypothetical protein
MTLIDRPYLPTDQPRMIALARARADDNMHVFVKSDVQNDAAYAMYRNTGFQPAQDVRVYRKMLA